MQIWYCAGLYLLASGLYALYYGGDILVGFLWVIELGAGLIFFIFILHFTTFLYTHLPFLSLYLLVSILGMFYFFFMSTRMLPEWFFFNTHINYANLLWYAHQTELYVLYNAYFNWTYVEFLLINILLFLGIVLAISLFFLLRLLLVCLQFTRLTPDAARHHLSSIFIFRQQNFIQQQNTRAVTRSWQKAIRN